MIPPDTCAERERLRALCELVEAVALELLRLQKELEILVAEWNARLEGEKP